MPQIRQDLITGRWVAVATERARRPDSFTQAAKESVAAIPGFAAKAASLTQGLASGRLRVIQAVALAGG